MLAKVSLNVSENYHEGNPFISRLEAPPNLLIRAVASMRQDEAVASS